MHPEDLEGRKFDITYTNATGRKSSFPIEVDEGWLEDGFAYIGATNLDTDFELTLRLDRIESGIPNIQNYIPKRKKRMTIVRWLLLAVAVWVVMYFVR